MAKEVVPTKTAKQIRDKWNATYRLYRAVVAYQNHTGGGDGDENRDDSDGSSNEGDDSQGAKVNKAEDVDGEAIGAGKRKPSTKNGAEESSSKPATSKQLRKFAESKIFKIIDEV